MLKNFIQMSPHSKQYTFRKSWFHILRPLTFTGTICPVLAGTALASLKGPIRMELFIMILLAGVFVQFSINMLNEYFDFSNRQDRDRWASVDEPSYGNGPQFRMIPIVASGLIFVVVAISLWIAKESSFWIVLVGGVTFIFVFLYSGGSRPLSSVGLGEFQAVICLGIVPTSLAYGVQGYALDLDILTVIVPFASLGASMILSNNIRDLKKDIGFRITLAMTLGRVSAYRLLILLLSLAYSWVILMILLNVFSWKTIIIFFALPFALKLKSCFRIEASRKEEIHGMKWAAYHHWAFGVLFSIGLWLT